MSTITKQKLRKIIASMGVSEEPAAIAAFLMARRHMYQLGISWGDIAKASILDETSEPSSKPSPHPWQAPQHDDPISEPQEAKAQDKKPSSSRYHRQEGGHKAASNFKPRWYKTIRQGHDVPASAAGTLRIVEERQTQKGKPMLVVEIENDRDIISPLLIFDMSLIHRIKQRLGTGNPVLHVDAEIKTSADPGKTPVITDLII